MGQMKIKKEIVDKVNKAFEKKERMKKFLFKCIETHICPVCGKECLLPKVSYPLYKCGNCGYTVHLDTIKE